ncbi:MAG TPA: hypothetical protein VF059_08160 [Casimicrobiaceae bacterium]
MSSWFWKARARELHRHQQTDDAKRASTETPVKEPERDREVVKEAEKVPA